MVGQSVHHHRESEKVAAHDEHQEEELSCAQEFTAETPEAQPSKQDFTGISHRMDVRILQLELSYHVSGICGQETQSHNQDHRSEEISASANTSFLSTKK
jgi:hypothetical protein